MSSTLRKTLLEKKIVSLHISRETLIEYLTESYCLMTRHSITDLLIWKKKPPIDLQNFIDTFFKEKLHVGLSNDAMSILKSPKPKPPYMEGSIKIKREELKEEFYENCNINYQTKNYEENIESHNVKRLKTHDEFVAYSDPIDNSNLENDQDNMQDCDIYNKINSLRKCGMWPASMLPKVIEYPHPLYIHDYFLHEIKWMSYDFNQERKWKTALAFKIINQTSKYKKLATSSSGINNKGAIKVSCNIADLVRKFWNSVIKMVCQKEEKVAPEDKIVAKKLPIINYGIKLMKEFINLDDMDDQQILLDIVLPSMTILATRDEVEKLISQETPKRYLQEDKDSINQVYSSIILSDEDLLEAVNANLDAPNLISKRALQNWHCQDDLTFQEEMDYEEFNNSLCQQPKSLFDKPSPILVKLRKEVSNYLRFEIERQGPLYPSQAHFQSQLLNKAKNAFKINPLGSPKITDINLPHKWIITEAWALIKAIKFYQSFYFGTIVLSPGHTPNWDFAAEYTTSVGCTYRSPKECRSYYENIIVPREKNTLSLRDYMSNCKKPKIKHLNKLETGPLLTYKMYVQDKNHSYKKYFGERLDNILAHKCPLSKHTYQRFRAGHKSPIPSENSQTAPMDGSTISAVRALGNYGVNYANPVDPYSLLKCKIDRLVREKKHQQLQQAKNLVPEFSASLQNGNKLSQQLYAPGPIVPEATYPFVPNVQQPSVQQLRGQQATKTTFPSFNNNGAGVEIALGNGGAFTKICPKNQGAQLNEHNSNSNVKRQSIVNTPSNNNHAQQHSNSSVNSSFIRANYCQATTQPLLSIQPKPVVSLPSNASGNILYQQNLQQQTPFSGLSYVLGANSPKVVGGSGSGGAVYSLLSSMTHEGAPIKRGSGPPVFNSNTASSTNFTKISSTLKQPNNPSGTPFNQLSYAQHHLINNVLTASVGDSTTLESSSIGKGIPLPISQVYQNLYASNAIYNKVNTLNKWFEKLDKTTVAPVLTSTGTASSNVVTNFKIAGLEFLLNNQSQTQQQHQQLSHQGQNDTGLGGINLTSTNIYNLLQQHANSLKARTLPNPVFNPSQQQGSGDTKGANLNLVSILQQQQHGKDAGNSSQTSGPPIQFYNISQMPVPNQPKLSHKNTLATPFSNAPSQVASPHTTK